MYRRMKFLWMVLALTVGMARADFANDLNVAAAFCKAGQHEEAIQAYLALADNGTDADQRFEVVRTAAACARLHTPGGEARALTLCDQAGPDFYAKACRASVYEWMVSPSNVVADLGAEDIAAWPEALAALGFDVRARAYFSLKNGLAAADDFLKTFQFGTRTVKWAALQRLGDTYWKLLDDELLAEVCYRKCMAAYGGGWPGLQARVNLGELLVAQERYDAALQALTVPSTIGGYWKTALLIGTANAQTAAGNPADAIKALEEALATPGLYNSQKQTCERLLAELKGNPAP